MVTGLLVLVAMICGVAGAMMLTQATVGVGLICGGCLIGIIARIAQAASYHAESKK